MICILTVYTCLKWFKSRYEIPAYTIIERTFEELKESQSELLKQRFKELKEFNKESWSELLKQTFDGFKESVAR